MSATTSSLLRAACDAWPGWSKVACYRDAARETLVIQLSVSELAFDAAIGIEGPGALVDKLMQGASVQQLAKKVLMHQQRCGLRRYGRSKTR